MLILIFVLFILLFIVKSQTISKTAQIKNKNYASGIASLEKKQI